MRGFIRHRGTTWTAYWSTTDPATGKRRQHSKGGFVRKEPARPPKGDSAREHLNTVVGAVQEGSWRKDQALTVAQLLQEHWLPAKRSEGISKNSAAQYRDALKWLVPHIGGLRAPALTPGDVQALADTLRTTRTSRGRKGLSPRSIQVAIGTLKAAYRWGVEVELLSRNPISGVQRPKVEPPLPTGWSAEYSRAFLTSTTDDRLAALWALALTRGLRRGELAGLRWDAVDLPQSTVKIVHTLVMVDGHVEESTPKTKASRRTVPLDAHLAKVITARRKAQAAERLRAGEAWTDSGYVFTNERGERLSPDWIADRFETLLRAAGLPRIKLHGTRHTAATLMLAAGVHPKVVQEMLGHSHVSITLGIYGHVMPGMAEEAGAALSAALLG